MLILSPNNVHALHNRGISYQRTKEYRKVCKCISCIIISIIRELKILHKPLKSKRKMRMHTLIEEYAMTK